MAIPTTKALLSERGVLNGEESDDNLSVLELNDRHSLISLEIQWNELVASARDDLFHRHEFIRIWIDNFAPYSASRIITAWDEQHSLAAALPLIEEETTLLGIPLRQLSSTSNAHWAHFDLVAKNPSWSASAIIDYLMDDLSWDVLRLDYVPEEGAAWELLDAARSHGLPCGIREVGDSPVASLPSTRKAFYERLPERLLTDCQKRCMALARLGEVTFERITGKDDLDVRLEEGFDLGAQLHGSAQENEGACSFYRELARSAAHNALLSCNLMRLDGKAIGFYFALQYRGRRMLLKSVFDRALEEHHLHQLMAQNVIEECIDARLHELQFPGHEIPWNRMWTDGNERHFSFYIFRNSLHLKAICKALLLSPFPAAGSPRPRPSRFE